MEEKYLFGNYKVCEICHKKLPPDCTDTICPICSEHLLFQQVKEFIRSNDVNEYQVAERFDIPVGLVRAWIREGRIQYKDSDIDKVRTNCQICGAQISFGNICPKCLKEQKTSGTTFKSHYTDAGTMRFLQSLSEEFQKKN